MQKTHGYRTSRGRTGPPLSLRASGLWRRSATKAPSAASRPTGRRPLVAQEKRSDQMRSALKKHWPLLQAKGWCILRVEYRLRPGGVEPPRRLNRRSVPSRPRMPIPPRAQAGAEDGSRVSFSSSSYRPRLVFTGRPVGPTSLLPAISHLPLIILEETPLECIVACSVGSLSRAQTF